MGKKKRRSGQQCTVHFLIPVRDRRGVAYPKSIRHRMERELATRFGGWSRVAASPLPGAWLNPVTGRIEHDASWRYEVGLASNRVRELDLYLAELGRRIGQAAIWRIVYPDTWAKAVPAAGTEDQSES